MIFAIVMAGGRGTRLKYPIEKPLFKLHKKALINYVLDNLFLSKLVEKVFIAVSPNTSETIKYLEKLNGDFEILDTPGVDYVSDLSFILDFFEKDSSDDTLLFINADLPFITSAIIDYVLDYYSKIDKDALSVLVPVEIFNRLGLNYEYEFNGTIPAGLNVLRSVNIVQDEEQLILPNLELAFNINTLEDADVAHNLLVNNMFKYDEVK